MAMDCQASLGHGVLVRVELSLFELNSSLFPAFGDALKRVTNGSMSFLSFSSYKESVKEFFTDILRELFSRYFVHEKFRSCLYCFS